MPNIKYFNVEYELFVWGDRVLILAMLPCSDWGHQHHIGEVLDINSQNPGVYLYSPIGINGMEKIIQLIRDYNEDNRAYRMSKTKQ